MITMTKKVLSECSTLLYDLSSTSVRKIRSEDLFVIIQLYIGSPSDSRLRTGQYAPRKAPG